MASVFYESDSEGEDEPMVSGTILPMTATVVILMSSSGVRGTLTALLDSGCTRCLLSPQVVEKLGMRLRKLQRPMASSQLDRLITGGVPATCLTEPVELKAGSHTETIRFIAAPGMKEAIVLGLAWLKKWNPSGKLDSNKWQMRKKKVSGPQELVRVLRSCCVAAVEKVKVETANTLEESDSSEPLIPKEYRDLAEVFGEKESDTLPTHCPTD